MAYPDTFYFATTKTAYAVGETVSLNTSSSWVHDYDGYSNLNYIDWWIYDYNTASWYDLSDTYSFSPYAGDYNWATFDVSIGNLGAGDYVLWGRAYDDQYNYSSTYTQGFSVYGGSNYAPDTFYFATTKTAYAVGETVSLNTSSSWVHDYDGYSNLNYIDWWIYDYNTASWYDLSDTYSFSPYAGDYNWATFDVSIGNLGAGDYVLWGRAYDDQYNYSSTYTQGFSVYGGSNLSVYSSSNTTDGDGGNGSDVDLTGYNFNVVYESAYADNLISVDFVIENKGSDYADDFYVDFYLSKDDYIDENDEYLGSYYVSGVYDNDNTGTLTKTLALSSISDSFWTGSGTYYIGMEINSDGYLAETDELNNSNVGFAYDYDDIYIYV